MKTKGILIGLGAAALAGGGLAALRFNDERFLDSIWSALERGARQHDAERFGPAMVAQAPEVARRYLLRAIRPWAAMPAGVALEMTAAIRTCPGCDWQPLTARQILVPGIGFVWRPASPGGWVLSGGDWYHGGRGGQRINLCGFPLVRTGGRDVARSARGRLALEAVLCPTALVPGRGGEWSAVDDGRAAWTTTIDGEELTLTIAVDDDGALLSVSMPRWGKVGGFWESSPFGVVVEEEGRFGDFRLPRKLTAMWGFGTEREEPFYRATLKSVELV